MNFLMITFCGTAVIQFRSKMGSAVHRSFHSPSSEAEFFNTDKEPSLVLTNKASGMICGGTTPKVICDKMGINPSHLSVWVKLTMARKSLMNKSRGCRSTVCTWDAKEKSLWRLTGGTNRHESWPGAFPGMDRASQNRQFTDILWKFGKLKLKSTKNG